METFIKADIFFFIASIATVIVVTLTTILLFYGIKAVKNLYAISEALKNDYKESYEFVAELKERLENNFIFQFFFPVSKRNSVSKLKEGDNKKND